MSPKNPGTGPITGLPKTKLAVEREQKNLAQKIKLCWDKLDDLDEKFADETDVKEKEKIQAEIDKTIEEQERLIALDQVASKLKWHIFNNLDADAKAKLGGEMEFISTPGSEFDGSLYEIENHAIDTGKIKDYLLEYSDTGVFLHLDKDNCTGPIPAKDDLDKKGDPNLRFKIRGPKGENLGDKLTYAEAEARLKKERDILLARYNKEIKDVETAVTTLGIKNIRELAASSKINLTNVKKDAEFFKKEGDTITEFIKITATGSRGGRGGTPKEAAGPFFKTENGSRVPYFEITYMSGIGTPGTKTEQRKLIKKDELAALLRGFKTEKEIKDEETPEATTPEVKLPEPSLERGREVMIEYNDLLLGQNKWNATGPERTEQHQFIEKIEKEIPLAWLEKNLHLYNRMREMVLMEEGPRLTKWRNDRTNQETIFAQIRQNVDGSYVRMAPNAQGVLQGTPISAEEYERLRKDIILLNDELFTLDRTKKKAEYGVLQSEITALEALGNTRTPEQNTELSRKKTQLSQKRSEYVDLLTQEDAFYKKFGATDTEAAHLTKALGHEEKVAQLEEELAVKEPERDALAVKEAAKEAWDLETIVPPLELNRVIENTLTDLFSKNKNVEGVYLVSANPVAQGKGIEVTATIDFNENPDTKITKLLGKVPGVKKHVSAGSSIPVTVKFVIGKGSDGVNSLSVGTDANVFSVAAPGLNKEVLKKLTSDIKDKFQNGYSTDAGPGYKFNREILFGAGRALGKDLSKNRDGAILIENGNIVVIDAKYTEKAIKAIEKEIDTLKKIKPDQRTQEQNDQIEQKTQEILKRQIPKFSADEALSLQTLEREILTLRNEKTTEESNANDELRRALREARLVDRSYRTPPPVPPPPASGTTSTPGSTGPTNPGTVTGPTFTPATPTEIENFVGRVKATDLLDPADFEFYTNNKAEIDAKRIAIAEKEKQEHEQRILDLQNTFTAAGDPGYITTLRSLVGDQKVDDLLASIKTVDTNAFIAAAEKLIEETPITIEKGSRTEIEQRWAGEVAALNIPTVADLTGKSIIWHGPRVTITSAPLDKGGTYEFQTAEGMTISFNKNDEETTDYLLYQIGKTQAQEDALAALNKKYTEELRQFDEAEKEKSERDPLFTDAARIVVETGQGSASLLNRRLNLRSIERANTIIEQLTRAGILETTQGTVGRAVKISSLTELEDHLKTIS